MTCFHHLEWNLGSKSGKGDLFPSAKVGASSSGTAAILQGKLHFSNIDLNSTISDFRNPANMTKEELAKVREMTEKEKTFFFVEPGRCISQSLKAIGYSHLKSTIQEISVCIKR